MARTPNDDNGQEDNRSAHTSPARAKIPDTPGARLKAARIKAGYATVEDAALKIGVARRDSRGELRGYATYAQHESGHRALPARAAERYARHFGISPGYLLYGTIGDTPRIPVLGVIGARGRVLRARSAETLEAPRGEEGRAAEYGSFRIGDVDMWPFLREGDYVVYHLESFDKPPNPKGLNNRRCLVELVDGTMGVYAFTLERNGSITLNSARGAALRNARVRRATPVCWINMTHKSR